MQYLLFKDTTGFPNTLCISVNEQVVHGIPGNIELKEGDIVSVDCGVIMNEYYGDSAYTFAVGEIGENVEVLIQSYQRSLCIRVLKKQLTGKGLEILVLQFRAMLKLMVFLWLEKWLDMDWEKTS